MFTQTEISNWCPIHTKLFFFFFLSPLFTIAPGTKQAAKKKVSVRVWFSLSHAQNQTLYLAVFLETSGTCLVSHNNIKQNSHHKNMHIYPWIRRMSTGRIMKLSQHTIIQINCKCWIIKDVYVCCCCRLFLTTIKTSELRACFYGLLLCHLITGVHVHSYWKEIKNTHTSTKVLQKWPWIIQYNHSSCI